MGTCGQPGYVFRDFCLEQGIEFIIFCLNPGIDLSIFVLNSCTKFFPDISAIRSVSRKISTKFDLSGNTDIQRLAFQHKPLLSSIPLPF